MSPVHESPGWPGLPPGVYRHSQPPLEIVIALLAAVIVSMLRGAAVIGHAPRADTVGIGSGAPIWGVAVNGGVFINYRGQDSYSYGALLHRELSWYLGDDLVFLDSESIKAGADFAHEILAQVRSCRALLAIIGPNWLTATDESGQRRIDDPQDRIRRELVEAFAADAKVIPVLTDGATLPGPQQLPADIAALAGRQFRQLRHRDASMDLRRIITDLTSTDPSLVAAVRIPHDAPYHPTGPAHPGSPHEEALADKADQLAAVVRRGLEHAVEQQRILDQDPLPLHWRPLPGTVTGGRNTPAFDPPTADIVRHLDDMVTAHERTKSGWLLVRGQAGSGKTGLVMRFALARLNRRDRRRPARVPVIFSVGSWNPGNTTLSSWLIGQLERDQPFLVGPSPNGGTWAEALLRAGHVLPILDGFDEIAIGQRKSALTALNASTLPLLVTSRQDELDAARKDSSVKPFATGIELTDLTLDDCVDYLRRASNTTVSHDAIAPTGWQYVLSELCDHPERPASVRLATVLTTPLMVTLARFIYESDRDPAELLDMAKFTTQKAVEDHILDNIIPTIYARLADNRPAAEEDRRRDAERAQHWLGYLAAHLRKLGTHDIEWWRLGNTMSPRSVMVVVGAAVGLATGLLAALAYGSESGLTYGFAAGLRTVAVNGSLDGLGVGLTFGIMHGFVSNLKRGGPTFEPSLMHIQFRGGTRQKLRASFLPRIRAGLVGGALFGILWSLVTVVIAIFLGYSGLRIVLVSLPELAIGIVLGAGVGITVALGSGFEAVIEKDDRDKFVRPSDLLHTNRTTVLTQMLLVGLVIGTGYGIFFSFIAGPAGGLVTGILAGLITGLGVCTLTAWGRWVVLARIWLPITGRLPRRLNAFLDDAYQRGVLRQAGAVYQFRHARLRDRLGAVYQKRHTV